LTALLQSAPEYTILESERQRALLLARRQALLIELGALEEYLQLPRSVKPHAERKREGRYGVELT
jgi:hypothetical protein